MRKTVIAVLCGASATLAPTFASAQAWEPTKPIEFVATAGPWFRPVATRAPQPLAAVQET